MNPSVLLQYLMSTPHGQSILSTLLSRLNGGQLGQMFPRPGQPPSSQPQPSPSQPLPPPAPQQNNPQQANPQAPRPYAPPPWTQGQTNPMARLMSMYRGLQLPMVAQAQGSGQPPMPGIGGASPGAGPGGPGAGGVMTL